MVTNIEEIKKKIEEIDLQAVLVGLGVIFLVVAGIFYFKGSKKKTKPQPSPEEVLVEENNLVEKQGEKTKELSEKERGELKEEVKAVLSGEGVREAKLEGEGRGTVKSAYSDGRFYLNAQISDLEPTSKGYYYQGWLEKEGRDPVSLGRVKMNGKQGELFYLSSEDYSNYSKVGITLEPENGDQIPGETVLSGSF